MVEGSKLGESHIQESLVFESNKEKAKERRKLSKSYVDIIIEA
jgi:hypothetical protein